MLLSCTIWVQVLDIPESEKLHFVQITSPSSPGYLIRHVHALACISLSPTIHICIYKSCVKLICKSAGLFLLKYLLL